MKKQSFLQAPQKGDVYSRMSMRCSRGRGLLVLDTSLDKQVAASSWEYDDCNRKGRKHNCKLKFCDNVQLQKQQQQHIITA